MNWLAVASVFITVGVGVSILMGICALAGVKGMVFKKLLNKIPFESKYKERIVGAVIYFIFVPFFITSTLLVAGIALTPDEVWAEEARIRAEEQMKKQEEEKVMQEAKAAEETAKKEAEEKAKRHTPAPIDKPKFTPTSEKGSLVNYPAGHEAEFSLEEGKKIFEETFMKNVSKYPYPVSGIDSIPTGDKQVIEIDGHHYYRYNVTGLGKELKTFGVDIDTGDIVNVEWTKSGYIITPLNKWFEKQQEMKSTWEKRDAENKKRKEKEAKEKNQKFRGLEIVEIRFPTNMSVGVTVKNVSNTEFTGGTLCLDAYNINGVSLPKVYIPINALRPGEVYYNEMFCSDHVYRVEAREVSYF